MKKNEYINRFKIALLILTAMIAAPTSLLAATKTVCPTGCDFTTIQAAIDAAATGDTINVSPNTGGYLEALTVDKPVKIIGKKSLNGADAWTTGTAGSSSGPVLKYLTGYPEMISFQSNNIELKGFEIDVQGGALAGGTLMGSTLMGTTISYLNIQYCTVKMDASTKGLTVDYGNSLENATINYCSFTGPAAAADAAWFAVSNSPSLADVGGAVNGITVTYNTILQATSELQLYRDIANVTYAHNTFSNSNGYIKLSKPPGGTGFVQGITVTFNTFNNSTKPFADEYAVAVADTVIEADANGDWGENLAIHFNNILQDDAAGPYPIVGFQNSSLSAGTSEITATHNWWNSTQGPRIFPDDTGTSTQPDVSQKVGFEDFSSAPITGGVAAVTAVPGTAVTATDASINVKLEVQPKAAATGAVKVFAAKYSASPVSTAITSPLPVSNAYYDLLAYPSSVDNVEAITATFYYPTGYTLNATNPAYWYNRSTGNWSSWQLGKRTISATPVTFNGVTYGGYVRVRADAASTPSLSQLTGTPVGLSGTAVTTTTTSSNTSTTTAAVSTTTTVVASTTTTVRPTSTSSVRPTTTTTAPVPKLTVTPGSLNYGADKITQNFTITNTGASILNWTINKDEINYAQGADWIFDIAPASGETNKEQDTVTVTISKAGLVPGTYTASIPISSDGGDKTVSVSMEVTQEENPALNLNPRVLYLKDTDTSGTIEIANARNGTLVWTIGTPVYLNDNGIHWISSVTPAAGSTAAEKVAVSIEVNRDRLRGGIYIATIPVTSNGRDRTIGVVMFVARDAQQYPRTNVDPFILFLNKTDVQKTFTISNAGTGTLVWQLGAVKYHQQQQGWITSVSPQAGETTTEPVTITINADSSKFGQGDRGLFGATIPVLSNGGNKNVFIYVWIPLLQYE
jgi:hypothetical protein